MKKHIAVAIPTFNRLKYLKSNVNMVLKQQLEQDARLSLVISNSASSDGTEQYLDQLCSEHENVHCFNQKAETETENLKFLSQTVPDDVDWVWMMGDDDALTDESCIKTILDVIAKCDSADLAFLHACQARRSKNSGQATLMPVDQLCQRFGYHEMLGWMSSLIVSRDIFCTAMLEAHQKINQEEGSVTDIGSCFSAYTHSYYLYKHLYGMKGVFVDLPLVEPQDDAQTQESIDRWSKIRMGERYFFVVDDMLALKNEGKLPDGCTTEFFRYHTYHLWDRYFTTLFAELLNPNISFEEKQQQSFVARHQAHWNRIKNMADIIREPSTKKLMKIRTNHGIELANLFYRTGGNNSTVAKMLHDQFNMANEPTYPFSITL